MHQLRAASLINKINAKKQSENINTNAYIWHTYNSCHKFLHFLPIIGDELHQSKKKISLLTRKKMHPCSQITQPFRIERCDLRSSRKFARMLRRLISVSSLPFSEFLRSPQSPLFFSRLPRCPSSCPSPITPATQNTVTWSLLAGERTLGTRPWE